MERTELKAPELAFMSISEADDVLAQDARFATEAAVIGGRMMNVWKSGPKHIADVLMMTDAWSDEVFLVAGSKCATFEGFRRAVSNCACALVAAGVGPGDRVALLMRNRIEWPVAFFAIMLLGAIAVPVNGWETDEKIADMLSNVGARYLISDVPLQAADEQMDVVWSESGASRTLDEIIPSAETWSELVVTPTDFPALDPDAIGAIFFTSGTNGWPKGVPLTHRAMAASLRNSEYQRARYALRYSPIAASPQPRPTALFPVPLFHVTAAIAGLLVATASGAKMVLMNRWDPKEGFRLIERERVTLLGGVPTLPLQMLQQASLDGYDLSSLTDFLYGGAPAPSSLPSELRARFGARSATGWGMTETASTFLLNSGLDYLGRPKSCGLVVPRVNEVRIVDALDQPVAVGEKGELQVRGLTVTQGYWNAPAATTGAFTHDGWFRTGDLVSMDDQGFVTISDRIKDVIIRGGENIFTVEIEDALTSHPDILEAAVFARAHPTLGEEVVAVIVTRASGTPDLVELRNFLNSRLARQKVPVELLPIDFSLPRNAAGKVLKSDLKQLFVAGSDRISDENTVSTASPCGG